MLSFHHRRSSAMRSRIPPKKGFTAWCVEKGALFPKRPFPHKKEESIAKRMIKYLLFARSH
ncbi:hypothetical protein, partial [Desulfovibrio sp.]|uniref:hypothetical protein n=1 Tax=Desulfovibrio sp. TaxID=885 RepID=UPI0030775A88